MALKGMVNAAGTTIMVATRPTITMIVNHKRVRWCMPTPVSTQKSRRHREAGATYSGQDYSLTGGSCQKNASRGLCLPSVGVHSILNGKDFRGPVCIDISPSSTPLSVRAKHGTGSAGSSVGCYSRWLSFGRNSLLRLLRSLWFIRCPITPEGGGVGHAPFPGRNALLTNPINCAPTSIPIHIAVRIWRLRGTWRSTPRGWRRYNAKRVVQCWRNIGVACGVPVDGSDVELTAAIEGTAPEDAKGSRSHLYELVR